MPAGLRAPAARAGLPYRSSRRPGAFRRASGLSWSAAGQSAFESAALMTRARRARSRCWCADPPSRGCAAVRRSSSSSAGSGRIVYAPTDVGPLWYSRLVATPALFTPSAARDAGPDRVALDPAGVLVLRQGAARRRSGSARRTEVVGAEPTGEGLRVSLSDGSVREVDHLMFGTGYKVDVTRYAFLGEGILARSARRRRISGAAPRTGDLGGGSAHAGRAGGAELRADHAVRLGQLVWRVTACAGHVGAGSALDRRVNRPAAAARRGRLAAAGRRSPANARFVHTAADSIGSARAGSVVVRDPIEGVERVREKIANERERWTKAKPVAPDPRGRRHCTPCSAHRLALRRSPIDSTLCARSWVSSRQRDWRRARLVLGLGRRGSGSRSCGFLPHRAQRSQASWSRPGSRGDSPRG